MPNITEIAPPLNLLTGVEFFSSPQHELNEDSSTTVRMWT